jgi:hypothetical protein
MKLFRLLIFEKFKKKVENFENFKKKFSYFDVFLHGMQRYYKISEKNENFKKKIKKVEKIENFKIFFAYFDVFLHETQRYHTVFRKMQKNSQAFISVLSQSVSVRYN